MLAQQPVTLWDAIDDLTEEAEEAPDAPVLWPGASHRGLGRGGIPPGYSVARGSHRGYMRSGYAD